MNDADERLERLEERLAAVERQLDALRQRLDSDRTAPENRPDLASHLLKARQERHRREDTELAVPPVPPDQPFDLDLSPLGWLESDAGNAARQPEEPSAPTPLPPTPAHAPRERFASEPAPAEPVKPSVPPAESPLSVIARNLRQLGVLPPEHTGSIEEQIGSWWMTRIGMLLGVIGIASFGIYISRNTPAWLRLIELVFIAGVVTAGGWRIERKLPRFGEVVFGGGLALLYFAAFGAYAIPGIKVIGDPTVGLFAQLAAVVVIGVLALLRRSQPLSNMAATFGFVACLFSARWGLDWSALATALVIYAGAVYLFLGRGWFQPFFVSIAGVWVIYAAAFHLHWRPGVQAGYERAIAYLACVMAATIAADWFAAKLEKLPPRQPRLIMQYLNTSGALVLAFLATYFLYRDHLAATYFTFGAILLAASIAYYLTGADFNLMHGFFIKATALVTLGVIAHFGGYARFVALAVQSAILLASAWRTRLKVNEAAALVVWTLSLFFLSDKLLHVEPAMLLWSRDGVLALVWLVISAVVLSLYGRLFHTEDDAARRQVSLALGLAFGVGVMLIGLVLVDPQWRPIALTLLSAALAVYALVPRHWVTLLAALPAFAAAHVAQWGYGTKVDLRLAWLNESIVVEYTFAIAVCLNLALRKYPRFANRPEARQAVHFAHLLWMLTLLAVPFASFNLENWFLMSVVAAWAATGLAFIENTGLPARLGFWPMIYGLLLFAYSRFSDLKLLPYLQFDFYLDLAILGAFAHLASSWRPGAFRIRADENQSVTVPRLLHFGVVVLIVHVALLHMFPRETLLWAYGGAALAFGSLAWLTEIRFALWGGVYFVLAGQGLCYASGMKETFLFPGLVIALLTLALAPAARRLPSPPSAAALQQAQGVAAVAALALADLLFLHQGGEAWKHFVTVCWGAAAVAIVALGFWERAKPLRLVGLAGLALCIPRAFIVDIHSMFYRIAAFILLGAALLVVGYIYHKYERLLDRNE